MVIKSKKINLLACCLILLYLLSLTTQVSASDTQTANLFIETESKAVIGKNLETITYADTKNVSINAVELVISYDSEKLIYSGYSDSASMIKLWITPPYAEKNKVYLSGIMPGGIKGVYNPQNEDENLGPIPLVDLFFITKSEGETIIDFVNSKILENDGTGKPLEHKTEKKEINIGDNPDTPTKYKPKTEDGLTWGTEIYRWVIVFLTIILIILLSLLIWKNRTKLLKSIKEFKRIK